MAMMAMMAMMTSDPKKSFWTKNERNREIAALGRNEQNLVP